ncbi:MAG: hypothetical protein E6R09_16000 [Rhodocyclaceae bacterium]|nr:MAG: hypothetical protein E6R09_16000 [Rhodocyclaceae bacterium]
MNPKAAWAGESAIDPLSQYVSSVLRLNQQMHRFQDNKNAIAASLGRAAAALRSIPVAKVPQR